MKKYIIPEIEIVSFETEEILLESGIPPKDTLNGEDATDIGGVLFGPEFE